MHERGKRMAEIFWTGSNWANDNWEIVKTYGSIVFLKDGSADIVGESNTWGKMSRCICAQNSVIRITWPMEGDASSMSLPQLPEEGIESLVLDR